MVTISRIVEKMIKENPSLEIALSKDIISYSKLARYLREEVESEFGKKITDTAIMQALKRIREKSERMYEKKERFYALEINTNSNIMSVTIGKSNRLPKIMQDVYSMPELEEGFVLNATHGNNQTTFLISKIIEPKLEELLEGEKIVAKMDSLSQISIRFDHKMFETAGFIVYVLKDLTWNNINIIEIVSTYTELIIIVKNEDLMKAYQILQKQLL
jgi:aspartokinase